MTSESPTATLRRGSYFPRRLLERLRRVEQAPISMVDAVYLLGASTRQVEKLALAQLLSGAVPRLHVAERRPDRPVLPMAGATAIGAAVHLPATAIEEAGTCPR
ncbi:transposase [Streptomyces sp. NPDC058293]|uniref:transposase n=1 Tax=Streptomyces sp. NPDC058293 TaxID=3346429 RepID=UPI0036E1D55F